MATQVQVRRGTTAQNAVFIGAQGEVAYDTQQKRLSVHDGVSAGGTPTATKAEVDSKEPALGYLPEDVANKSTNTSLGASNVLYPTQNAVKTYADTKQAALGFTPENVANKDTDGTLAANSDTKYASQKATKTYADTKQSALGFTPENVANKDTDGTLAANSDTKYASQKATKTYADTKQSALGFTPENVANKDTDGTLAANSDTKYASQKATKTYADTKQSALGFTPENVANKDTDGTLAANSDTKYASQKATKTYADAVASAAASALSTGLALKVAKAGDSMTGTLTVTPATANTPALVLGNNSAPAGDPTNATENWATSGEWQYRSSAASEGAGQTNRVHNRAEEVVGAGTDFSLPTGALARVDFGTTDPEIILPTAGTYEIDSGALYIATALGAADLVQIRVRNSTDSTFVSIAVNCAAALASSQFFVSVSAILTVTASKTLQLWAFNSSSARGTLFSESTFIRYKRLY